GGRGGGLCQGAGGRAGWAAGKPADLFGALLCLPVDRLAAGGEGDRAESQQTSRKVIFVTVLAEKASRFAAVHSRHAFHCSALVSPVAPWVRTCALAPVQNGDEYPAAMEQPSDLR